MASFYLEPFDFRTLIVDYLLGSAEFFFFAMIIAISFFSAKFNLPTNVFLLILLIALIIFRVYLESVVYIIVLIIMGVIIFKILQKVFE